MFGLLKSNKEKRSNVYAVRSSFENLFDSKKELTNSVLVADMDVEPTVAPLVLENIESHEKNTFNFEENGINDEFKTEPTVSATSGFSENFVLESLFSRKAAPEVTPAEPPVMVKVDEPLPEIQTPFETPVIEESEKPIQTTIPIVFADSESVNAAEAPIVEAPVEAENENAFTESSDYQSAASVTLDELSLKLDELFEKSYADFEVSEEQAENDYTEEIPFEEANIEEPVQEITDSPIEEESVEEESYEETSEEQSLLEQILSENLLAEEQETQEETYEEPEEVLEEAQEVTEEPVVEEPIEEECIQEEPVEEVIEEPVQEESIEETIEEPEPIEEPEAVEEENESDYVEEVQDEPEEEVIEEETEEIEPEETIEEIVEEVKEDPIEETVEEAEPEENQEEESVLEEAPVPELKDNNVLLISEYDRRVFLPYTMNDLYEYLDKFPEKYADEYDVIRKEFVLPIGYFNNFFYTSRFRETFALYKDREGRSSIEALINAFRVMTMSDLHPAIIAACKGERVLNDYIKHLKRGDLENFKYFEINYKMNPIK